jgi:two-component system nitrate/nitrite response regulator NarL
MPPIRVLIADDHAVVREGIRRILDGEPEFSIVGEAGTAADAVRLAGAHQPDVVVLDITMPGGSGLDAASAIRTEAPGAAVLMLSMHDHAEYVRESMRAGAQGYLLKDSAATELRQAVRAVHRGERYFAAAGAPDGADAGGALAGLTPRERDVLRGIARGRTNKEIAADLNIGTRTVETHRESLMRKVGIRTIAGLTMLAHQTGLVGS